MVLLNPGKALFNFQMGLFFYFLFHLIRIFSDSHKVYTERQKPVLWDICSASDLRKRSKKTQICCKWGKVLLCNLEISITIQTLFPCPQKLVRNSAFSQSGLKSVLAPWNGITFLPALPQTRSGWPLFAVCLFCDSQTNDMVLFLHPHATTEHLPWINPTPWCCWDQFHCTSHQQMSLQLCFSFFLTG